MQTNYKIKPLKEKVGKQPVKTHHLSSFGILNRNGLEISNGRELPADEEISENKKTEFSDWTMPEQLIGFIQARNHDFF